MKVVKLGNIEIANNKPFVLFGGPCQLESLDHALFLAENIQKICNKYNIGYIFKASFDKANRTSIHGKRGLGLEEGLKVLAKVKEQIGCPILTDIHNEHQCKPVAECADVLQIPAFLCRQTDLLKAAAETGKVVKVKKGQFLAPWDMHKVHEKLIAFGAKDIILTERGASFGYNTLVTDMRSLVIMAQTGAPVVFDATHSVQQPGGLGGSSGGQREFVPVLARAAIAVGVAGLFMEIHQDPDNAPSDGPCMLRLEDLDSVLSKLKQYDLITKAS